MTRFREGWRYDGQMPFEYVKTTNNDHVYSTRTALGARGADEEELTEGRYIPAGASLAIKTHQEH